MKWWHDRVHCSQRTEGLQSVRVNSHPERETGLWTLLRSVPDWSSCFSTACSKKKNVFQVVSNVHACGWSARLLGSHIHEVVKSYFPWQFICALSLPLGFSWSINTEKKIKQNGIWKSNGKSGRPGMTFVWRRALPLQVTHLLSWWVYFLWKQVG